MVVSLVAVFLLSVAYWLLPVGIDIAALVVIDGVGMFLGILLGYRAARLELPLVSCTFGTTWRLVACFFFIQALAEVGMKSLFCLVADVACEQLGSAVRTGNNFAWILAEYWLVLSIGLGAGFLLHRLIGARLRQSTRGDVIGRVVWIVVEALIAALVAAVVGFGASELRGPAAEDKSNLVSESDDSDP